MEFVAHRGRRSRRVYGQYVLPVLDAGQLVARKTDRATGALLVLGAYAEPGTDWAPGALTAPAVLGRACPLRWRRRGRPWLPAAILWPRPPSLRRPAGLEASRSCRPSTLVQAAVLGDPQLLKRARL